MLTNDITPEEYEDLQRANEQQKQDAWCNEHRLNQRDYDKLQTQYDKTPGLNDGFSASGEHYNAMHLLKTFGHIANGRDEAMKLMERLLACEPGVF